MTELLKNPSSYYDACVDPLLPAKDAFVIRAEHLARYRFAAKVIRQKYFHTIYDIACGDGYGTKILSRACHAVYGFDISEAFLDIARAKYEDKQIRYVHVDITKEIPLQEKRPDCVVSFETLEHVQEPEKLLASFGELLPTGGYLILSTPNAKMEPKKHGKSKNPFHVSIFTKEQLIQAVLEAGFVVEGVYGQPYTNMLYHRMRWLMRLLNTITERTHILFYLFSQIGKVTTDSQDQSYSIIVVARKA